MVKNQTKYGFSPSESAMGCSSMTSEMNLAHFFAYWRMAGTLMDPVQLT